jgi:hypothetical protein
MAVRVAPEQIHNLQQMEVGINGPDGATRLFIVNGQFDPQLNLRSGGGPVAQNQVFTLLIGPPLTRQQFIRAIGTASLAQMIVNLRVADLVNQEFGWRISDTDADWDDESSRVELRLEIYLTVTGIDNTVLSGAVAFQVMILAAIAA